MAISPSDLAAHIEQHGPYLYHSSAPDQLQSLLTHGIVPRAQLDTAQRGGCYDSMEFSRPGHVYLGTAEMIWRSLHAAPLVAVDLRKLDPELICTDEDHFSDWKHGKGDYLLDYLNVPSYIGWALARAADLELPLRYEQRSFMYSCSPLKLEAISMGSWADEHADSLDAPGQVRLSLSMGSISYAGTIAPSALSEIDKVSGVLNPCAAIAVCSTYQPLSDTMAAHA